MKPPSFPLYVLLLIPTAIAWFMFGWNMGSNQRATACFRQCVENQCVEACR